MCNRKCSEARETLFTRGTTKFNHFFSLYTLLSVIYQTSAYSCPNIANSLSSPQTVNMMEYM